jgi:hypothetical protein
MEKYESLPYNRTLREAGGVEGQKIVGENWLPEKRGEDGVN